MTNIFLYGFGCLLLLSITALAAVETNDDGKSLENLITESLQPSLDLKGLSRQRRQLNGISALTLASAGLASTTGVLGIVIGKAHGRKHARHRRRPAYNYAYTTSAHGRYRGKRSVDVKERKPTESLESVQPTDVESRQINGISALALAAAGVATTTGVLGLAIGKAYGRKHPVKHHHHHHHGHKEHRPRPTYSAYSAPSYRSKRSADKVEEEDEDEAAIIRMAVMMDQQSGGCVARLLCQLHQQQLMDQQFQQRLMALNDEDPE